MRYTDSELADIRAEQACNHARECAAWASGAYDPAIIDVPDVAYDMRMAAEHAVHEHLAAVGDAAEVRAIAAHAEAWEQYAMDTMWWILDNQPRASITPEMVARKNAAIAAARERTTAELAARAAAVHTEASRLARVGRALEAYTLARLRGRGRYVLAVVVERGAQAA